MPYPIHFNADRPSRFSRMQLLVRLAALIVLGMLGISFGTLFAILYVALPIYVAIRIAALGSGRDYLRGDVPRVLFTLRWFAALGAWAGLVTERLPARGPEETVSLLVEEPSWEPSTGAAMLRIATGLPSALVFALRSALGSLVWIWAALSILISERVGAGAFQYLLGLQRWGVRLLAHQACLVEGYPPFSFSEQQPPASAGNLAPGTSGA